MREYRTVTLTPEQHKVVVVTMENLREMYAEWLQEAEDDWGLKRKYRNQIIEMYRRMLKESEELLHTLHNYTPETLNSEDL